MTGAEAADICRISGLSWQALDPLTHPLALLANLAVLVATREGISEDAAIAEVQSKPMAELVSCVSPQ